LSRPGWKPVHFSLDENSRTQIIILPEDENHSPEQTFFISLLTLPRKLPMPAEKSASCNVTPGPQAGVAKTKTALFFIQ
jgi:hypothetical protein